ncbi:MAG TPA: 4'-phosphopantetheinyl transferase superfamily protein [Solirubrobacterales bacterium]|nr:4'-phosphopantetheinyl transferase superfamily protein [Solirubrobacterales bacterium]
MIDGVHIWRAHLEGPSWPVLRRALGHYLEAEPREDDIALGEHGKPALRAASGLEFNLSHSRNLMLVAVAERPVGVDVEAIRPRGDLVALAERFLDAEAARAVHLAIGTERERVFYRAWTRHEARLKCLGVGLSTARLQSSTPEVQDRSLAVQNLEIAPTYAAAVAVLGGEVGPIECRSL